MRPIAKRTSTAPSVDLPAGRAGDGPEGRSGGTTARHPAGAVGPWRLRRPTALLMTFGLAACGGSQEPAAPDEQAGSTPPAAVSQAGSGDGSRAGGSDGPVTRTIGGQEVAVDADGIPLHEPGDPDLMIPLVGEPELSPAAIEIDPLELLPEDLPIGPAARDEIVEFVRGMQPLKESLTSDHHDRHFILNQRAARRLSQSTDEEIGWAALHAFTNYPGEHTDVRRELLTIGARVSPKEAAPLLETLAFTYGHRMSDRAEAVLLLGEAAPETLLLGARPYLERQGKPFQTAPPDEFYLRGWITACERTGRDPVPMLAQCAMNLALEPYTRYLAVQTLAKHTDDPLARGALEAALVESTGDSYIRRMAAQSIVAGYSSEEACKILEQVASREADINMARFLDVTIQENCR